MDDDKTIDNNDELTEDTHSNYKPADMFDAAAVHHLSGHWATTARTVSLVATRTAPTIVVCRSAATRSTPSSTTRRTATGLTSSTSRSTLLIHASRALASLRMVGPMASLAPR